jgi:glycosyltransferase involved in cell wall biosynthesis
MNSNQKLKVLFVSHSSYYYGAEQSFLFLLQNINRDEFEPIVLFPENDTTKILVKEVSALGMKTFFCESYARWIDFVAAEYDLYRNLKEELYLADYVGGIIRDEEVDVVYTNTITKLCGALAAKITNKPHIYHVREVLKDHPLNSFFDENVTLRLVDYFSDVLIANSIFTTKQFDKVSKKEKLRHVYNAIDTAKFKLSKNRDILKQELGISDERKIIGIVGTVHSHKNHETLIRAIKLLADDDFSADLVSIGTSLPDYRHYLDALIDRLGLSSRVHFLSFRDDIVDIYNDLDVVVVASLAEPFGRTTIEAMASGKPVVATNSGASPELILDGVTGILVSPNSPDEMAGAIKKILSNAELAFSMGERGKKHVDSVFTKHKYIAGIEDSIRHALSSTLRGACLSFEEEINTITEILSFDDLNRFFFYFYLDKNNSSNCQHNVKRTGISNSAKAESAYVKHISNTEILHHKIEVLEDIVKQLALEKSRLLNSRSWKLTKPFREMRKIVNKYVGRSR